MQYDAFVTLALLLLFAVFLIGPWREACTAFARQVVFEKRDAIFDLAADGKLSFTSREYRTIRASLEKMIRFAHDLTIYRFAWLSGAITATRKDDEASDLFLAIKSLPDPEVRDRVFRLVFEAHRAVLLMMLCKSPVLAVFGLVVLVPIGTLRRLRDTRRKVFRNSAELVQVEAEHASA